MSIRLLLLVCSLLVASAHAAFGNGAVVLDWDDLKPAQIEFDDPFEKLSGEQLSKLALVARYRERFADNPATGSDSLRDEYQRSLDELAVDGVDVDGLLAQRQAIMEKRRALAQATRAELSGRLVRMPGYMLPLEFEDTKVTEFLLVPWVGACIHTPPPAANQIVHVRFAPGVELEGGMYAPVWVSGILQTESGNPELSFVDGRRNVSVSYLMAADEIEPYRQ